MIGVEFRAAGKVERGVARLGQDCGVLLRVVVLGKNRSANVGHWVIQATYLDNHKVICGHVEDNQADVVEALQPSLSGVVGDRHGDDVPCENVSRGSGVQVIGRVPIFRFLPSLFTLFAVPTLPGVNNLLLTRLIRACRIGGIITLDVQDGATAREHLGLLCDLQVLLDVFDGAYISPVERSSPRSRARIRVRRETLVDTDRVVPPPEHVGVRNVGVGGHNTGASHGQGAACVVDINQRPSEKPGITSPLTLEFANLHAFERDNRITSIIFVRLGLFSPEREPD